MKQPQGTSTTSRALTEKPPFAVVAKDEGTNPAVSHASAVARDERIRKMAYALYEARGRAGGHDLDDWLQAEAQLARAEPMTSPPRH